MPTIDGARADSKRAMEQADDFFGIADYAAFLRDAHALLAHHSEEKARKNFNLAWLIKELERVEIRGATSTTRRAGTESTLHMVARSGRWYADFLATD